MQVIFNDQKIFVGWKYENPELEGLMDAYGVDSIEAREMTEPQIIEAINDGIRRTNVSYGLSIPIICSLPKPSITHCYFLREDKAVLAKESVKRYKHDKFDKDKARRYSMAKVLLTNFPGEGNEELRKAFYNAYLNRKVKVVKELTAV